jgi:hypothetical protein
VVLGCDWLERFNPMKIHCKAKWVAIPYRDQTKILLGILSQLQVGDVV